MKISLKTKFDPASYSRKWATGSNLETFKRFKRRIEVMEIEFAKMVSKSRIDENFLGGGASVLDLGCGDGWASKVLIDNLKLNYGKYKGIDCCKKILEVHAFSNSYDPFSDCILLNLDYNHMKYEEKYDMIIALNSLYGMSEENVLRYCSLLNQGGKFIILLNSRYGLFSIFNHVFMADWYDAEYIETVLTNNNIKYVKQQLSFSFPEASSLSEINWLSYLVEEESIPQNALELYNSNLVEKETLIIVSQD